MRGRSIGLVAAWLAAAPYLLATPAPAGGAAELKPATIVAFDRYVRATEARMATEVNGSSPFLWIDRQPTSARRQIDATLAAGRVVVEHLETREAGKSIDVPDGIVHHWVGTVFLPGVPLDRVIRFVQNYAGYSQAFGPMVQSARVTSHRDEHFDVAMRTSMHKVITVVIDADYGIDYKHLASTRVWTRSVATNVREVSNAGDANETSTPAEHGGGYLWRMNTYCSFDARPEGTYEQCESISLSRGLPFGIGWMISPFVTSVPREALEFTLGRVREALTHATSF
jgi:hypothetical protein